MKMPSISIILSVGTIVIVLGLIFQFRKALSRLLGLEEKAPVDYEDTPIPIGSTLSPQFDSTPYVVRLIEVMVAMPDSSPRCAAYKSLLDLNDAEFIIVTNDYKHKVGRTLRSDMDGNFYDGCNIFFNRYGMQVRARMDELGVIG